MKTIDLHNWNRKQHFDHFIKMEDPYFSVTVAFNVTNAYEYAKKNKISFFGVYLHDCMKGINAVENLKYRFVNNEIVVYDTIHASATIMRTDKTFGCSYIKFSNELSEFLANIKKEKERIENSSDLFPPKNSLDCIYCSAMPWFRFTGHKEPHPGYVESVPKLAFSRTEEINGQIMMNVSISANHALVDGYHIGLFTKAFQDNLINHKILAKTNN